MIDDRVESCYKKPCQGLQILCSYHRKSSPKPRGNWNLRLAKGEGSFHLNVLTWWLIEVFHSYQVKAFQIQLFPFQNHFYYWVMNHGFSEFKLEASSPFFVLLIILDKKYISYKPLNGIEDMSLCICGVCICILCVCESFTCYLINIKITLE